MKRVAIVCRNLDLEYLVINKSVPVVSSKDTVSETVSLWMRKTGIIGTVMGKIADVVERDFSTGNPIPFTVMLCLKCEGRPDLDWFPYHKLQETVRGYGWIKYIQRDGKTVDINYPQQMDLRCTVLSGIEAEIKYCEKLISNSPTVKGVNYLKTQLCLLKKRRELECQEV
jgi:hypothetical protein